MMRTHGNKQSSATGAVLCLLLCCLMSLQAHAQIFKCKINGQVVYRDKACPASTEQPLDLPDLITVPATELSEGSASTPPQYSSSRWYEGHEGYRTALRVSRVQNAPIYLYAYTDWCGYCRKFESKMLPMPRVKEVLSSYVKVRLNPEHDDKNRALFKRWGGKGYPSFWVQKTADGNPLRSRSPFRKKGMMSIGEFVDQYAIGNFSK